MAKCGLSNTEQWKLRINRMASKRCLHLSQPIGLRRICIELKEPFMIKSKLIQFSSYWTIKFSSIKNSIWFSFTVKKVYDLFMANGRNSSSAPIMNLTKNIWRKIHTNSGEANAAKAQMNRRHIRRARSYRNWIAWKWVHSEACPYRRWLVYLFIHFVLIMW